MENKNMKEVYLTPLAEAVFISLGPVMQQGSLDPPGGGNEGTGNENWTMMFPDGFSDNPIFSL